MRCPPNRRHPTLKTDNHLGVRYTLPRHLGCVSRDC